MVKNHFCVIRYDFYYMQVAYLLEMRCVLVDGKCFRARSRLPPAYTYVIGVTYLNFDIDRGVPVLTPILAAGISITCYLVCA
jgi:hypothetical protein